MTCIDFGAVESLDGRHRGALHARVLRGREGAARAGRDRSASGRTPTTSATPICGRSSRRSARSSLTSCCSWSAKATSCWWDRASPSGRGSTSSAAPGRGRVSHRTSLTSRSAAPTCRSHWPPAHAPTSTGIRPAPSCSATIAEPRVLRTARTVRRGVRRRGADSAIRARQVNAAACSHEGAWSS